MAGVAVTHTQVEPLRLAALRLARRLRKHSGAPLTPSQLSALSTLERWGPMRVGRLAEREGISKSSVTRLAGRLEEFGLAERQSDASDARSWQVSITERGRALLADSNRRADEYLARQISALSPQDQRSLLSALPALERLLEIKT